MIWAPTSVHQAALARLLRRLAHDLGGVSVATVQREWDAAIASIPPADTVTIVGAGTVVSPSLLARAREIPAETGYTIDVAAGPKWPESGVIRMIAGDAIDREHVEDEIAERRTRALPLPSGVEVSNGRGMLAVRIADPAQLVEAEETIRRASYKDTDAKIARFNRRISLPISVKLIPTPLTANQLSIILVAIGFYSAWLFSLGHYWTGVLAAFLSLAASVLDGCDGEIARLKYQESALGCWIETFGDYSYYLAIFAGLTIGAVRQTHWGAFYWLGGIALAGMLLSFGILIFLRSRITGGRPEKLHAVARDAIQVRTDVLVSHRLAHVVRGDACRDALRHHGLFTAVRTAGHRRPRRHRCERLLDQSRDEDAAPARTLRGPGGCVATMLPGSTRRCSIRSSQSSKPSRRCPPSSTAGTSSGSTASIPSTTCSFS